jgi:hypothetical protein
VHFVVLEPLFDGNRTAKQIRRILRQFFPEDLARLIYGA